MTKTQIEHLNREVQAVMDETGRTEMAAASIVVAHRVDLLLAAGSPRAPSKPPEAPARPAPEHHARRHALPPKKPPG